MSRRSRTRSVTNHYPGRASSIRSMPRGAKVVWDFETRRYNQVSPSYSRPDRGVVRSMLMPRTTALIKKARAVVNMGLAGSFQAQLFAPLDKAKQWVKTPTLCARRYMRRQVLHALGIAGKKGLSGPSYSVESKVKC